MKRKKLAGDLGGERREKRGDEERDCDEFVRGAEAVNKAIRCRSVMLTASFRSPECMGIDLGSGVWSASSVDMLEYEKRLDCLFLIRQSIQSIRNIQNTEYV